MPDNGAGQFLKQLGIGFDLLAIAAAQALCSKLDWREWILDLMGDAPRDVGPCRLALVKQLAGYVFKGNHMAR